MAINFPSSPINGQLHTEGGITWTFVSAKNVWQVTMVGTIPVHTHPQSDIVNLVADLAGKAALSHTHTAANISDSTAAGRAILLAASAAAQRALISAAIKSQTDEAISGYIEAPTAKTYKLVVKTPHGGTITEATTICESGTGTATFKINTTNLGGTTNAVSVSEQSQIHSSANVFAAGDDIQVAFSSLATLIGCSYTLKYTRTLL